MARTSTGNTPEAQQGDGHDSPDTVSTAEGEVTLPPIDSAAQTKLNAAPTSDTSAGLPNPVETVGQPLVYANGDVVTVPDASDDEQGSYALTSPGGTTVTVTSSARRDVLLARGYTSA